METKGRDACVTILCREPRSTLREQNGDELPLPHALAAKELQQHWGDWQVLKHPSRPRQQHAIGWHRDRCSRVPRDWSLASAPRHRQGVGIWTDITTATKHRIVVWVSDRDLRMSIASFTIVEPYLLERCSSYSNREEPLESRSLPCRERPAALRIASNHFEPGLRRHDRKTP